MANFCSCSLGSALGAGEKSWLVTSFLCLFECEGAEPRVRISEAPMLAKASKMDIAVDAPIEFP